MKTKRIYFKFNYGYVVVIFWYDASFYCGQIKMLIQPSTIEEESSINFGPTNFYKNKIVTFFLNWGLYKLLVLLT